MYIIDIKDYPQNNNWNSKINSVPSIPGGKNMLMQNLRQLLLLVDKGDSFDQVPQLQGSNSKITLHDLCVHQLSPIDLVKRDWDGKWILSDFSKRWLDCEDPLYLAAYFCAHVKYFAEILYYLDSPKTARDLYDIAINEYDLSWKTPTTINGRMIWLRHFNLIEFQEFSLLYHITDNGKAFLKTIHPMLPMDVIKNEDETKNESDIQFDTQILEYYHSVNYQIRKMAIGYFPCHISTFATTLSELLSQLSKDNHIDSICDYTMHQYHIKESSTKSALNTISSLGIIERKSNTTYDITDIGNTWIKYSDNLSLLPLFQMRYLFIFELLYELNDRCLSVKELATIAKISYGFDKENIFEINKRIELLKSAKLIINVSAQKYTLTQRGKLLLNKYDVEFSVNKPSLHQHDASPSFGNDIITDLRLAAKDSYNPDKFEKLTAEFFALLGFETEWLGGSGKTDVLLKTSNTPQDTFVVTIDAKTTNSSKVTDNLVNFDTLKEHQIKHRSDYIAVVGRDFNERLIKRAKEHDAALFNRDSLERIYNLNVNTPVKTCNYRLLFEQNGLVDISTFDHIIKKKEDTSDLLNAVMAILVAESHDPFTQGRLTVRDIYRSLRDNRKKSTSPDIDNLKAVLDFLSCPLIDCVNRDGQTFFATGSICDLTNTLNYLKRKSKN